MEMVKRLVRQKKTFPHVVSTPREVGESHHHEFGIWSVSVVCTENFIRVDDGPESPKLAE